MNEGSGWGERGRVGNENNDWLRETQLIKVTTYEYQFSINQSINQSSSPCFKTERLLQRWSASSKLSTSLVHECASIVNNLLLIQLTCCNWCE